MPAKTALIVTSISPPNPVLSALARGSIEHGVRFIVVGDTRSPKEFSLEGCEFYDIAAQRAHGFRFADACPTGHYARKNIGYLLALRDGASVILETDDDNFPRPEFWTQRRLRHRGDMCDRRGWVNIYRHFSDANIWPRGLPLDEIGQLPGGSTREGSADCPIQQGLADDNPDVDAIYRLILPLPQSFRSGRIALAAGTWCPFNSQNTAWFAEAAPLLYLPSYCSFRMTDIWRSFVAQRIAWENGWSVLFHESTVWQDRNEHNLMRDFQDEVPGYLHNRAICDRLAACKLKGGVAAMPGDLRICYAAMIEGGFIDAKELPLLEAWLSDLEAIGRMASKSGTAE